MPFINIYKTGSSKLTLMENYFFNYIILIFTEQNWNLSVSNLE